MLDATRWIDRHWRRLRWGQFLAVCADQLALGLIAVGCVILLSKLFVPALWPHVLWILAGFTLVPWLAWRKVRQSAFTRDEAVALLDRKLNAGGLLMMLAEAPDEQWRTHLPQIEALWRNSLPKFRPKRFSSLVAVPAAFAIACCFVPLRDNSQVLATPRKIAQKTTEELQAILKTLEEAEALDEEKKAELKEQIEKFANETRDQPLTHEQWETADALRQSMQMKWEKNERNVSAASSAVEQLLTELASQGELSAEQMQQLEAALGENLQSLAKKATQGDQSGMSEELQKSLEQLAQSGKMSLPQDAAERQKMLEELKEKLEQESEKLAQQRSQCQGLCQGGGQCQGDGNGAGEQPGSGGISRGGGSAPMMWGKESDLANTKFKEVVLPPGILEDPSEQVLRITAHEPEVNPADTAPRQTLRENDPAAGRATWERKLNPKHRDVVRKFFHSERATQPIPDDGAL